MTAQTKAVIKSYFETGDKPTQAQFGDLVDSYVDTNGGTLTAGTIVSAAITNPSSFTASTDQAAAIRLAIGTAREVVTSARTYYVRTDGSDSNTGLTNTAGGAFLTLQHAVNVVANNIIINDVQITIQLGTGTYNESVVLKPYVGSFNYNSNPVIIVGDNATPSNVLLTNSGNPIGAFNCSTTWKLKGLKIQSTGGATAVLSDWGSSINLDGNNILDSTGILLRAQYASRVELLIGSTTTIATAFTSFATCLSGSRILGQGTAGQVGITLTGTPAMTVFAQVTDGGSEIDLQSVTFTGSATGTRFDASYGGKILPAGTSLPGNATGSYYVTNITLAGTNTPVQTPLTMGVASYGLVLKQGANGKCGTFVCNGATPVTVNNTSIAITDTVSISLNAVGGTVGAIPHLATITAGAGFTTAGTAGDTSTYNYTVISNAA